MKGINRIGVHKVCGGGLNGEPPSGGVAHTEGGVEGE